MACPACGCAVHEAMAPRQMTCTQCGEQRWPHLTATAALAPYVCVRCRSGASEGRRKGARAAHAAKARQRQHPRAHEATG